MGLDFIYRVKPNLRKGWDRAVNRLSQPELTRTRASETRTITVNPEPGCTLVPNEKYELREVGTSFAVYRQSELVALCSNPPESVRAEIRKEGGVALGVFHASRKHSGLVDISICTSEPIGDQ
jgi:hypothetical protein